MGGQVSRNAFPEIERETNEREDRMANARYERGNVVVSVRFRDTDMRVSGNYTPAQAPRFDSRIGTSRPASHADLSVQRVTLNGEDVTALHTEAELRALRDLALQELQP